MYDLQTATTIVADDQYLIELNQSSIDNIYLRVRDNHIKEVVLDNQSLGLDIKSTRGNILNIPFPNASTQEYYNFQYAQNITSSTPLDMVTAGTKNFSDDFTNHCKRMYYKKYEINR